MVCIRSLVFFLRIRRPPRSTRTDTLFPYTTLFRAEIDAETIRHLTLANKAQQRAWLALFEGDDTYAPRGSQLKAWLFGGGAISVKAALFDMADYSRSEERRVGKECVSTCRSRWSPYT